MAPHPVVGAKGLPHPTIESSHPLGLLLEDSKSLLDCFFADSSTPLGMLVDSVRALREDSPHPLPLVLLESLRLTEVKGVTLAPDLQEDSAPQAGLDDPSLLPPSFRLADEPLGEGARLLSWDDDQSLGLLYEGSPCFMETFVELYSRSVFRALFHWEESGWMKEQP